MAYSNVLPGWAMAEYLWLVYAARIAADLKGLDLSLDALFAPTPGDALALTEVG